MSSQKVVVPPPAEWAQVERLLGSRTLQGSVSLCKLLQFFAEAGADPTGTALGEYHIATTVFGRKDDFDPRVDSCVRVQVARLRSKLTEYFATEGTHDPLTVEIPKGSYRLVFTHRHDNHTVAEADLSNERSPGNSTQTPAPPPLPTGALAAPSTWRRWSAVLMAAVILLGGTVIFLALRLHALSSQVESARPPEILRQFWQPFLTNRETPLIVFANSSLTLASEGYPGSHARPAGGPVVAQIYTGVGEVVGVRNVSVLLAQFNRRVQVKRSLLLSLDDVQNRDLIFVGGYLSNRDLANVLPQSAISFGFEDGMGKPPPPRHFNGQQPEEGEDQAIITLARAPLPGYWALVLAGTSTLSTQAAVEFASRPDSVGALMKRLGPEGVHAPFKCYLKTKIVKGVPLEATIVAVKRL